MAVKTGFALLCPGLESKYAMARPVIALAFCLLIVPLLAAQLKVDVALVNVVTTVTDDRGRYVSDLTPDDFIVYEDGQPQTIAHFSQSNDLPVSVGIVLDTSGSMERKIATATSSVERFVRTIHEDDDIFLMTFSERPILRQDFTDDRNRLAAALRRVTVGGGTALYDALEDGLEKIRHGKHDKKAILLISDGEDTSSYATFDDASSAVRESEHLVYCLGISPANSGIFRERTPPVRIPRFPRIPGWPLTSFQFPQRSPRSGRTSGGDTVDMKVLQALADQSGGKAWLLSGNLSENRGSEIQKAFDEIAAELRNQYSIGYYPPHHLDDKKWHRI
jgi:Ca-activated chloride channel family protein